MNVGRFCLKNYVLKKVTQPIAPGYTLTDIQNYMKTKPCVSQTLAFFSDPQEDEDEDFDKIFSKFIKVFDGKKLTLEQVSALFVVACMFYFVADVPKYDDLRMYMIFKTFSSVDTLSPLHIHLLTKELWSGLEKEDDINFVLNIIQMSPIIATAGLTGNCIAMCLNWKIIGEITESESKMFRFHDLEEFINMLNSLEEENIKSTDLIKVVYMLANAIGFIVATAICGKNEKLVEFGYRNYFEHKLSLLVELKQYCNYLCDTLADTSTIIKEENNLYTKIKQILHIRAILPLELKIEELKDPIYMSKDL